MLFDLDREVTIWTGLKLLIFGGQRLSRSVNSLVGWYFIEWPLFSLRLRSRFRDSEVVGFHIGSDFESMTKYWLCNKKFRIVNMISSAVLGLVKVKKFSVSKVLYAWV
jgi:hypothetical protein